MQHSIYPVSLRSLSHPPLSSTSFAQCLISRRLSCRRSLPIVNSYSPRYSSEFLIELFPTEIEVNLWLTEICIFMASNKAAHSITIQKQGGWAHRCFKSPSSGLSSTSPPSICCYARLQRVCLPGRPLFTRISKAAQVAGNNSTPTTECKLNSARIISIVLFKVLWPPTPGGWPQSSQCKFTESTSAQLITSRSS